MRADLAKETPWIPIKHILAFDAFDVTDAAKAVVIGMLRMRSNMYP